MELKVWEGGDLLRSLGGARCRLQGTEGREQSWRAEEGAEGGGMQCN